MKEFEFTLQKEDLDSFFFAIREKKDVIKILMNTIKFILMDKYIVKKTNVGKILLRIDKNNRLFFFVEKKFYSISFPFQVSFLNNEYYFSSKYIDIIDTKMASDIIGLLSCDKEQETCEPIDFFEPIDEYSIQENEYIWTLLKELMLYETGYIRYDDDEENENGNLHPRYHYDISYSSNATYKIGLKSSIENKELIDLLDINSDCHFIT